jgi:flagellar hook-basal body complex protein FliE
MNILSASQVYGDVVKLARTNQAHFAGVGEAAASSQSPNPEKAFGNLLFSALNDVNNSQVNAMDLAQQMITSPDTVDVQDLTIAMGEANLAISMTKAIVDRALTAYRDIINVR